MADDNALRAMIAQKMGGATPGEAQPAPPAGAPMAGASRPAGSQVSAIAQVRQAVKLLSEALPQLGATSPIGLAVMKAIQGLAKHAPESKTTAGMDATVLKDLAAKAQQQGPLQALQRAIPGQGQGAATPPTPSPGG